MYKRVFRPFWSVDIIKTENWLRSMSIKGYKLVKVHFHSCQFIFEKAESKTINYMLCRHKYNINVMCRPLESTGWHDICSKGFWTVLANENPMESIKAFPQREGILKRNTIIKHGLGFILLYYFIMSLPMFMLFDFSLIGFFSNPVSVLSIGIFILIVKLNQSDKKVGIENNSDLGLNFTVPKGSKLDSTMKKKLKKEKRLIRKLKLGWCYAPDKTELWLEDMERQGYNLYKMGVLGLTFHFIKNKPRNIKYAIDYQVKANDNYFQLHKGNGWNIVYATLSNLTKYTIWSKDYEKIVPRFYSDSKDVLNHARKNCLTYLILNIPMILLSIYVITSEFKWSSILNHGPNYINIIIFTIIIIEFSSFTFLSTGYYIRTRKRVNSFNEI